jgi:hypothetical protein
LATLPLGTLPTLINVIVVVWPVADEAKFSGVAVRIGIGVGILVAVGAGRVEERLVGIDSAVGVAILRVMVGYTTCRGRTEIVGEETVRSVGVTVGTAKSASDIAVTP